MGVSTTHMILVQSLGVMASAYRFALTLTINLGQQHGASASCHRLMPVSVSPARYGDALKLARCEGQLLGHFEHKTNAQP
jgi:hypothetical protein